MIYAICLNEQSSLIEESTFELDILNENISMYFNIIENSILNESETSDKIKSMIKNIIEYINRIFKLLSEKATKFVKMIKEYITKIKNEVRLIFTGTISADIPKITPTMERVGRIINRVESLELINKLIKHDIEYTDDDLKEKINNIMGHEELGDIENLNIEDMIEFVHKDKLSPDEYIKEFDKSANVQVMLDTIENLDSCKKEFTNVAKSIQKEAEQENDPKKLNITSRLLKISTDLYNKSCSLYISAATKIINDMGAIRNKFGKRVNK